MVAFRSSGLQARLKALQTVTALADANDSRGQHSHHLIKKPISLKGQRQQSAAMGERGLLNCSYGIAREFAALRRKGAEIVLTGKAPKGRPQDVKLESLWHVPDASEFVRRENGAIANEIVVDLSSRGEARMEAASCLRRLHYTNRGRQVRVEGASPFAGIHLREDISMRALAERVNAGVGATRTMHSDVSSRDVLKRLFQNVLNGIG